MQEDSIGPVSYSVFLSDVRFLSSFFLCGTGHAYGFHKKNHEPYGRILKRWRSSGFYSGPKKKNRKKGVMNSINFLKKSDAGFTLIELLVVIAILAVLATAVVVIINPGQLVKQGRDSTRLSDIAALNNTLSMVLADVSNPSLGTAGTIYLSLPASNYDCSDLGFPVGGNYRCAPSTDFTKVDGTGWIPVNFNALSTGSALARLPIDPVNDAASLYYYEYFADPVSKTWKIQAVIESDKYQAEATKDAGTADSAYEKGADLTLGSSVFPSGWVRIPGNSTYDTSDFWVMKYEAKCAFLSAPTTGLTSPDSGYHTYSNSGTACTAGNSRIIASLQSGYPIANISHDTAKAYCAGLGSEYHLLTNEEWMTIARNAEAQVAANWTTGSTATGALFSGHNDNVPTNVALVAGPDADPYAGTGNVSPSNQKRTFTLSNGSVIWDVAGNVWEHVERSLSDTKVPQNQEPTLTTTADDGAGVAGWGEFTDISGYGALSYNELRPSDSSWNASKGMGRIYTYGDGETATTDRVLRRGGYWGRGSHAGAFAVLLSWGAGGTDGDVGFRCARE
jgi:prepilin-type N-terminal cleavage/methylation domain-containing protein